MKVEKLTKKILNAIHNSKRYDKFGRKQIVEELLVKKILCIIIKNEEK